MIEVYTRSVFMSLFQIRLDQIWQPKSGLSRFWK